MAVLDYPTAVPCTMAFALSRSRGRRRSSTGCRIAKDQDVMITTISTKPDALRLCRPVPLLERYSLLVDGRVAHGCCSMHLVGPLLGLDTVMCM